LAHQRLKTEALNAQLTRGALNHANKTTLHPKLERWKFECQGLLNARLLNGLQIDEVEGFSQ
jgi:hypothetical protein